MEKPKAELGEFLLNAWPQWSPDERVQFFELFQQQFFDGPSEEDPDFTQAEMDKMNYQRDAAIEFAEYAKRMQDSREVVVGTMERYEDSTERMKQGIENIFSRRGHLQPTSSKKPAGN